MTNVKMKINGSALLLIALLSLGVLLVFPPPVQGQGKPEQLREEFHKTYPLSPNGRINLENIQGDVQVQVWDRNEVKVDAIKTAYTRELLNDAEIEIDATADSLRIHTQYPDGNLTFNSEGYRRYQNPASVEYTLTVPRNARLNSIELVNGNLMIEGVAGDINASSVNGHVTGRNLRGEVKLATVNGPVEATFDRLDESKAVSLGSVNGSVVLIIPSDSNAIIKAGTVSGAITNDFGLPVRRGDWVGRELYGQLGRGGSRIKLGNVNGSLNIRHASDGRTLSPATSLISVSDSKNKNKNKAKGEDDDEDYDWDEDSDDAGQSARRAARDAQREAQRAQLEAQRAQREAQRAVVEAQRAAVEAQREAQRAAAEAQREAAQAAREAQQEASQAARAAQAEGVRAARDAQREAQRVVIEAQREAQRAVVEAQRAAREDAQKTVTIYDSGSYRLVERSNANFDVSGTPRLNVKTFDGAVSIHGWDKPQVVVTLIKRARSEKGLKGIQFNATKNGNQIEINADFDPKFAQQLAPGVTSTNASANLEIYVPRNVILRAASGDGHLALDGVTGEVDLLTADGSIDVVDGRGRILAKTDDGRIRIAKFDGSAEAITDDGRISLEGRFVQLAARTGDGSITLVVPANFNAVIEADAEKFVNESTLQVTEETTGPRKVRRWKIGKGGAVLTLRTGDGRIILRSTDEP
ncbi:MAG: DUF4097 family beta strand repeat protein [Acidobacteria bacterium]|nr:DUF4097 family beta strand repeat protein [Acidobacteriota bacterium]